VGCGRDHTLFALVEGLVQFIVKGEKNRKYVTIVAEQKEEAVAAN